MVEHMTVNHGVVGSNPTGGVGGAATPPSQKDCNFAHMHHSSE